MGSKVELLLILLIITVVASFALSPAKSTKRVELQVEQKDTEITNFTAYEINATSQQYKLAAAEGIKKGEQWIFKKPIVTTQNIKTLRSEYSIYKNSIVKFKGSVLVVKKDGSIFKSEIAMYNTKTAEFITDKKFNITKNRDILIGNNLYYNNKDRTTKAKDVNFTIKLRKRE